MVCTVRRTVNSSLASSSGLASRRLSSRQRRDHVLEDLVDGVLVLAGPARRPAGTRPCGSCRGSAPPAAALGGRRRLGEQPPQVAIVEVRVFEAVVRALAIVVLAQRLLQAGQRRQLAARDATRRPAGELLHQLVHVLELLQGRPVGVALAPLRVRLQPDGERFREVLVGMTLRVPGVQVQDEALAVGLRRVVLGILCGRRPEQLQPLAPPVQRIGVVDGVARLVAEDARGTSRGCRPRPRASARSSSFSRRGWAR